MKKHIIFCFVFAISSVLLYSQSAYDNVRQLFNTKDYEEATAYIPKAVKDNPKDQDFIILCGDIYYELERLDSALIMYRAANDIKGNDELITRKTAKTLSLLGKHKEAIEMMQEVIKKNKKDAINYLTLGQVYIAADSLKDAELRIIQARELDSKNPIAFTALGDLYFAKKVFELACSNYEEALRLDKSMIETRVKLAQAYYKHANYSTDNALSDELFNRSLKEWDLISQQDPKYAPAWFEKAKIYYLSRKYESVIKPMYEYLKLRPTGPKSSLGRWYLAHSLFEYTLYDSAIVQLEIAAKEIDTVKNKANNYIAQSHFYQKRYKEAAAKYAEMKKTTQLDVNDLLKYATSAINSQDTVTAINVYREVIDKDPTKCQLMYNVGSLVLRAMKKNDESIYFFQKHIAFCKDSLTPKSYYWLGYAHLFSERPDSASLYFKKSIELDSTYLLAQIYLADALTQVENKEEAQVWLNSVIDKGSLDTAKYSRELTQAFAKLCNLVLKEKNIKELQLTAKKWTEFDPNSAYGWLYLAVAYHNQQDKDNACRCYKKVMQIDPKNENAKKNYNALQCGG